MREEIKLPFRSGFYVKDHMLLSKGGVCNPLLGRSRSESLYILCGLEIGEDRLPVDESVLVMLNSGVKEALDYGAVSYHTCAEVALVSYHVLRKDKTGKYARFAVKLLDLGPGGGGRTTIRHGGSLIMLDYTWDDKDTEGCSFPSKNNKDDSLWTDGTAVTNAIIMQQKRNEIGATEVYYDVTRATKVMDALKPHRGSR